MTAQQVLILRPGEVHFLDQVRFQDWPQVEQSTFVNAYVNTRSIFTPDPEMWAASAGPVAYLTRAKCLLPPLPPTYEVFSMRSEGDD